MSDRYLLLVEKCAHCISYYETDSGARIDTIALPEYPHEFVVDSGGRYAYVAHYGVEGSGNVGPGGHSIIQIDIAGRAIARTIDVWPYNRLHGIQIDAHDRLYVASEQQATLLVFDNPATATRPT